MRKWNGWLIFFVAGHLALGLVYSWTTPAFEASDEGAHYAFVQWLATGHALPVQSASETFAEAPWQQEGSQPPLYYYLGAALTAWVDTSDYHDVLVPNPFSRVGVPGTSHNATLYRHPARPEPLQKTLLAVALVRWFSLILSGVTVWLTWVLAGQVFPQQRAVQVAATALVAFNPMALFVNASVNNDNLLMLLSTAALVVMLPFMQREAPRYTWRAVGTGILLGLAALTKVSGLVLWPLAALAVGWGCWRARDARRFVLNGILILGPAVLISGWWFWRNWELYGDWLGLAQMVAVAHPRAVPITLFDLIRTEGQGFFASYWGVFGVFSILPAGWVLAVYDVLTAASVLGGGWLLVRAWRARHAAEHWAELTWLAIFCVLTLVGVINWTLQTLASQGRLMFGAIAPLSIFMAAGLLAFAPLTWARRLSAVLAVALTTLAALIPPVYIAPHYAPPRLLTEADLPADLNPLHATFAGTVELVGYTASDAPRYPGEEQPVTLYWRALTPVQQDYAFALHLLGRDSRELGKIDTWPGGGNYPTSQWRAGDLFADSYWLPIAASAETPSILQLDMAAWLGQPDNQLPIVAADGQALSSVKMRIGRVVSRAAENRVPALAQPSTLEYGLKLQGIDPLSPDGALTLYWSTDQPVPGDFTVFLHLLDASGQQVAQDDGKPLNGDWPTSAWLPGQTVVDRRQLTLPGGLPSGRYTVNLGLYDAASGARVSAFDQAGKQWQDNIIVIEQSLESR